jgi:hypothetical protein
MTTGSGILYLIRSGQGETWSQLCEAVGLEPGLTGTLHYMVLHQVQALVEAGLVSCDPADELSFPTLTTRFSVSPAWPKIQAALGISLEQVARFKPGKSLVVEPYFGEPAPLRPALDLFVLMPFAPAMKPLYDDHISPVAARLGLSVARADDFFNITAIISDIWAAIASARVIVADCTGRNPNVFYEIGLAHAIGKPVVLITANSDDVPFDLRHLRYIQYDFTPRGMEAFEQRLEASIRTVSGDAVPTEDVPSSSTSHPEDRRTKGEAPV